jgi:hypothetical protein
MEQSQGPLMGLLASVGVNYVSYNSYFNNAANISIKTAFINEISNWQNSNAPLTMDKVAKFNNYYTCWMKENTPLIRSTLPFSCSNYYTPPPAAVIPPTLMNGTYIYNVNETFVNGATSYSLYIRPRDTFYYRINNTGDFISALIVGPSEAPIGSWKIGNTNADGEFVLIGTLVDTNSVLKNYATLTQYLDYIWSLPSIITPVPLNVTASADNVNGRINVNFDSINLPGTLYTVSSTAGGYTATGANPPIAVTVPRGTEYTFKVIATRNGVNTNLSVETNPITLAASEEFRNYSFKGVLPKISLLQGDYHPYD